MLLMWERLLENNENIVILDHNSLPLLLTTQLEVLGSLDSNLVLPLALGALNLEDQLLGGLGLTPQDGLGLTSKSSLLSIVPPSTLGHFALSRFLVLGNLHVLIAPTAVCSSGLRNVDHLDFSCRSESSKCS